MNNDKKLVSIIESNLIHEVQIAKTILENEGIKCFVFDENINNLYGGNIGGYKLKINELDLTKAKQILEEAQSE
jgi:hypothetical protein